jgi:hypothetical protein
MTLGPLAVLPSHQRSGVGDPAWMVRGALAPGEVRYPAAFEQ